MSKFFNQLNNIKAGRAKVRAYGEGGTVDALEAARDYLKEKYNDPEAGIPTKVATTLGLVPVNLARSAARAVTAPTRSMTDENFNPEEEAANMAGFVTTGGIGLSKAGLGPKGDVLGMGVGGKKFPAAYKESYVKPSWLKVKQESAERRMAETPGGKGRQGKGIDDSETAYLSEPVDLPVDIVSKLKGANEEMPRSGVLYTPKGERMFNKYDDLMEKVKANGWDEKKAGAIDISVNHRGEAFIEEGNNRAAVAKALGRQTIPVRIQWKNGGEQADGILHPSKVAEYEKTPPPAALDAIGGKKAAPVSDVIPHGDVLGMGVGGDIHPSVLKAYEAAKRANSKLDYSENNYGNVSRNSSPQQQAAATRAEKKVGKAIRTAYPEFSQQETINLRQKLAAIDLWKNDPDLAEKVYPQFKPINKARGGAVHQRALGAKLFGLK